jgi:orotate phosphoribosyltransferase
VTIFVDSSGILDLVDRSDPAHALVVEAFTLGRSEALAINSSDAVVVVEDVITSGESASRALAALEEAGGNVLGILAVVDREEGGRPSLEARGRSVITLTTVSELGLET